MSPPWLPATVQELRLHPVGPVTMWSWVPAPWGSLPDGGALGCLRFCEGGRENLQDSRFETRSLFNAGLALSHAEPTGSLRPGWGAVPRSSHHVS